MPVVGAVAVRLPLRVPPRMLEQVPPLLLELELEPESEPEPALEQRLWQMHCPQFLCPQPPCPHCPCRLMRMWPPRAVSRQLLPPPLELVLSPALEREAGQELVLEPVLEQMRCRQFPCPQPPCPAWLRPSPTRRRERQQPHCWQSPATVQPAVASASEVQRP